MRRFLIAPALLALTISSARADLDLTPRPVSIGAGLLERAYFQDGAVKFAVTIKDDVKVSASEGGALFLFKNYAQASMRLRRSPLPKGLPFDEASLPEYLKAAEKMLPASAEAVTLLSQTPDALPLNHWKSCRFLYEYRVGPVIFHESITFLVFDTGEQIVIQTGSQQKDFEPVSARADQIMRRWHEVLPGDETGIN